MIKEFYPQDVRSKIRVYLNDKVISPLAATCIYMSSNPDETVDGWIDLVAGYDGKTKDEFKNLFYLCEDTELEQEYTEYNKTAREIGQSFIPRPKPAIWRHYGKIKWEIAK